MPFRIDGGLAWQLIDGEAIVVDLVGGRTLGLNGTGSLIWSLLADHEEEEIAQAVAQKFEIDPSAAREDVRAFIQVLRERGLVAECEE
jgi:hypothetical protein